MGGLADHRPPMTAPRTTARAGIEVVAWLLCAIPLVWIAIGIATSVSNRLSFSDTVLWALLWAVLTLPLWAPGLLLLRRAASWRRALTRRDA
jgi:hypothetical protein